MIVIGGCGRSGTSLLLSLLSCHPDLQAIPEETLKLASTPLDLTGFPSGRWVEKTPINVHNIPAILEVPEAQFIHIVRDGRDVVTSRHPLQPGPYVSAERWIRDVTAGKNMESHERVHTLRYRDLIYETSETLHSLCYFLDIPFAPEFMRYPQTATVQSHGAWDGPARPLSDSSVGRWQLPEHAETVERFMRKEKAVALLRHYSFI